MDPRYKRLRDVYINNIYLKSTSYKHYKFLSGNTIINPAFN